MSHAFYKTIYILKFINHISDITKLCYYLKRVLKIILQFGDYKMFQIFLIFPYKNPVNSLTKNIFKYFCCNNQPHKLNIIHSFNQYLVSKSTNHLINYKRHQESLLSLE